jgi:hypothetical protein
MQPDSPDGNSNSHCKAKATGKGRLELEITRRAARDRSEIKKKKTLPQFLPLFLGDERSAVAIHLPRYMISWPGFMAFGILSTKSINSILLITRPDG